MSFRDFLRRTSSTARHYPNTIGLQLVVERLDAYLDERDEKKQPSNSYYLVARQLQAELDNLRKLKRDQEVHHERTLSAVGHEAAKTQLALEAEMKQSAALRTELDRLRYEHRVVVKPGGINYVKSIDTSIFAAAFSQPTKMQEGDLYPLPQEVWYASATSLAEHPVAANILRQSTHDSADWRR